jgi:DNA-binding CsgD family transcriptional regulator
MFDKIITQLAGQTIMIAQRLEGVAFFRAAKELYGLASITYVCTNIAVVSRGNQFAHCFYSDTCVKQFVSRTPVHIEASGGNADKAHSAPDSSLQLRPLCAGNDSGEGPYDFVLPLTGRCGETAMFGITADLASAESRAQQKTIRRECQILASYFHGHVLRINGHDSDHELLISARELDCLKWTAAGKTAWEASVILGITERTVRFHLNMAREKLNCATTTQAVAKAVAHQLIDV